MKRAATITEFISLFPYGVTELRRSYKKFFINALLISVSLHLAALGGYFLARYLAREEAPPERVVRIVKYAELGPPPSIQEQGGAPPAVAVTLPVARPSIGVPVPVPDAQVSKETTIATQQEMGEIAAPIIGTGSGESVVVTGQPSAEVEPGIDENVAVQVPPVAIVQVQPEYPAFAKVASLTGTVFVKALVDKDGKVKKAVAVRGPDVFYPAACAAAMKWVFKPAIQADKPVAVWVMLTFNFSQGD
jgi:protein TonB